MNSDYQSIWEDVLNRARSHFDVRTFDNWLLKTGIFDIRNGSAYISYRTVITKKLLEENQELFDSLLSEIIGEKITCQFMEYRELERIMPQTRLESMTSKYFNYQFNENYTFETFVEGNSNHEAYASCLAVCNQDQPMFNPLMLYGNSGLGKTHLLHAIGNYLKAERPEKKVCYMYSGDFVTLLIDAMKTKNVHGNHVETVKKDLLNCDYFLIDDIQNLKHSASQEVFFTVYNKLIENHSQIVVTSDIEPKNLQGLETRLISRLTQGLPINISSPEFETSKAILKKRLEGREESLAITEDVIDFLASKFSDDIRNLEGRLNRLLFNATLFRPEVIDIDFARSTFASDIEEEKTGDLSVKDIKKAVGKFYGLTSRDLEGKSRQKQIATARHICVYLCRELMELSYSAIGYELGSRDHTTISSSYKKACSLKKKDEDFARAIEKIKSTIS